MEVHHHSHLAVADAHKGKRPKWTHYFWEFLMLFLAVFCGFLAENIREHQIEHNREKQYMRSMLEDLKSDTALLTSASRYWDSINLSIDSLAASIEIPLTPANQGNPYRYLNKAMDYNSFAYNDRTISQLKNSGGFRLIRNHKVATKIILFDQFNNDAMKNIAELHASFYKIMMGLANKVFVQDIINRSFQSQKYSSDVDINMVDSLIRKNQSLLTGPNYNNLLFEFKNALLAYRKDYSNMKFGYDNLKEKMEELIGLIREEYHFD